MPAPYRKSSPVRVVPATTIRPPSCGRATADYVAHHAPVDRAPALDRKSHASRCERAVDRSRWCARASPRRTDVRSPRDAASVRDSRYWRSARARHGRAKRSQCISTERTFGTSRQRATRRALNDHFLRSQRGEKRARLISCFGLTEREPNFVIAAAAPRETDEIGVMCVDTLPL